MYIPQYSGTQVLRESRPIILGMIREMEDVIRTGTQVREGCLYQEVICSYVVYGGIICGIGAYVVYEETLYGYVL